MTITADHQSFYKETEPFPLFLEMGSNLVQASAVVLTLDDVQGIEKALTRGLRIIWDFNFPLPSVETLIHDQERFTSNVETIDRFVSDLWKEYKSNTLGVLLYKGRLDFSMTSQNNTDFTDWRSSNPDTPESIFVAELFAQYVHRLISFFPDEVLPFVFLDLEQIPSQALIAQLLSRHRFQHLVFGLKGVRIPVGLLSWETGFALGRAESKAHVAVCMPRDSRCTPDLLAKVDTLFERLAQQEIAYRIIAEERLTQEWDGIDTLMVFASALSPQGERMLRGFEAAGGEVQLI